MKSTPDNGEHQGWSVQETGDSSFTVRDYGFRVGREDSSVLSKSSQANGADALPAAASTGAINQLLKEEIINRKSSPNRLLGESGLKVALVNCG